MLYYSVTLIHLIKGAFLMHRKLRILFSALIVLALSILPTGVRAQFPTFDVDIVVDGCTIAIIVSSSDNSRDYLVYAYVSDQDDNEVASFEHDGFLPVTFLLTLSQSYSGSLYVDYEVVDFVWDEEEIDVNCTVETPAPATVGVPCGPALIGLGQGLLVRTTPLYWAPRKDAASNIVLQTTPDAKTYRVLGVDSTRSFYKIIIACQTYWVPLDTLVPNPDDVWRSAPLPTQVVN
jgi:hypothetical protein